MIDEERKKLRIAVNQPLETEKKINVTIKNNRKT